MVSFCISFKNVLLSSSEGNSFPYEVSIHISFCWFSSLSTLYVPDFPVSYHTLSPPFPWRLLWLGILIIILTILIFFYLKSLIHIHYIFWILTLAHRYSKYILIVFGCFIIRENMVNICGICFWNIAQIKKYNGESGEMAAEGYFVEFVDTVCQLEQLRVVLRV